METTEDERGHMVSIHMTMTFEDEYEEVVGDDTGVGR